MQGTLTRTNRFISLVIAPNVPCLWFPPADVTFKLTILRLTSVHLYIVNHHEPSKVGQQLPLNPQPPDFGILSVFNSITKVEKWINNYLRLPCRHKEFGILSVLNLGITVKKSPPPPVQCNLLISQNVVVWITTSNQTKGSSTLYHVFSSPLGLTCNFSTKQENNFCI